MNLFTFVYHLNLRKLISCMFMSGTDGVQAVCQCAGPVPSSVRLGADTVAAAVVRFVFFVAACGRITINHMLFHVCYPTVPLLMS